VASQTQEITVPDIGGADSVDVIEVLVKPGDVLKAEDPIVTLEGDKATMEVPTPVAGVVQSLKIKVGDKVSQGSPILILELTTSAASAPSPAPAKEAPAQIQVPVQAPAQPAIQAPVLANTEQGIYAGPAVRRLAQELNIDLQQISGSGEKNRITKSDLQAYIKQKMQSPSAGPAMGAGLALAPAPVVDFAKFGPIASMPLTKIQKSSGAFLHRNWVSIPHVTQFGDADITELEAFRQAQKAVADRAGVRLTPIVFIMKAVVSALQAFPRFNASLDASGENLILKNYFHIGVAVDTPNGLVVPVIRDVDKKGLLDLAKELGEISLKAREKGLGLSDMQGGCFSISSLGGIGGTAFTPIINAPEVAILGVSRSDMKPVYQNGSFVPRLMLPLSLSYDHRVIDGADAARFLVYLSERLSDIRMVLL
jgi:pyruvate dehydrogenase E2 component (dihydrolipoamide acetyltransferase)